jgi:2-polyprenyl-3-methyl-5-hydroxy-6-metoxy-1,4-benzoquinol methylase
MSAVTSSLQSGQLGETIRTRNAPNCAVCGREGKLLYENLTDRLFEAPGIWRFRKCLTTRCGVVWLDPAPLDEDIAIAYRTYSTHKAQQIIENRFLGSVYSRIRAAYIGQRYGYQNSSPNIGDKLLALTAYLNPIRRANFDLSVFYLHYKPSGRLLDLGCGSGSLLKELNKLGWQAEGIDFDPSAVKLARLSGLNVHLGEVEDQKFQDASFDAITACHVIEHISDPLGLLRECRRILRTDGSLVILTPNANSWGHRFYQDNWRGLEPPRHFRIFTPSAMQSIAREAGFDVVQSRSTVRASHILLESKQLRLSAKGLTAIDSKWKARLWEEIKGLAQWAGSIADAEAGEEVLLIAKK